MVKLDQLRTRNLVYTDDRQYGSIQSFGNYIVVETFNGTRGYTPDQLSPIPITANILSVCGFVLLDSAYVHKETFISLRHYEDGDVALIYDNEILEELAFVHQLQNLYLDITGKPLDPNLVGV